MKKVSIFPILAVIVLASCVSHQKIERQIAEKDKSIKQNAQKALTENFNQFGVTPATDTPFVFIGEIEIPAVKKSFDPKKFLAQYSPEAIAWLDHLDKNFDNWFYDNAEIVQPSNPSFKLEIWEAKYAIPNYQISYIFKEKPLSESEMYQALIYLISNQINASRAEEKEKLATWAWNSFHVKKKDEQVVSVTVGTVGQSTEFWYLNAEEFNSVSNGTYVFVRKN